MTRKPPRSLGDLGEFGFLGRLRYAFASVPRRGEVGLGDDAAVLSWTEDSLVLSADMLVEGVHFDLRYFRPEELGHRALAANLSDLAAMGADPVGYLVSLAAPPATPLALLDGIYRGMARLGRRHGARLLGGDTVRGPRLTLSLAIAGRVRAGEAVRRKGARPGDLLFATGEPGWSYLGLRLLAAGRPGRLSGWRREAALRHLTPAPRLAEGRGAARCGAVSAMIDVSDGILSDLSRLLEENGCGAVLDEGGFRVSRRFREAAAALRVDPLRAFLAGGEDYELLMAVRPRRLPAFLRASRSFPAGVFPLGILARDPGIRLRRADGRWIAGDGLPRGFAHFPGRRAGRG